MKKTKSGHRHHITSALRIFFWFSLGAILGLFFFVTSLFIYYRSTYQDRVYPGVLVAGVDFGGKSKADIASYFTNRNSIYAKTSFTFSHNQQEKTLTAKDLGLGYDGTLLADQAYSIGRSKNFFSNVYFMTKAYMHGVYLAASYRYDESKLAEIIVPFQQTIDIAPVDAEFTFENGKVTEFRSHSDGKKVDIESLKKTLDTYAIMLSRSDESKKIAIPIPVIIVKSELTLEKVNNMGIKELVGQGTSLFHGSIVNRIYNIEHASRELNGILVKPGDTFSFANALGDVSSLTGYKQAYVIQNGRTVLGDGGGVCQVSTTLFRAALDAGLPIVERNPHAYRVHYYEEDSLPGIDAAVYVPSVDLKFKNDTGNWILVQSRVDKEAMRLTFDIYGTKDGREVTINKPVIVSQSPAPEPLYQDNPDLPKGVVKQVDWAAPGAKVYFTRQVKKGGKIVIDETFNSSYRPWQAVYEVGTKEG